MTQDNASPIANDTLPPPPPERAVMCEKCIYWKELPIPDNGMDDSAGQIEGSCHLNAPVVVSAMSPTGKLRVTSTFPTVPNNEWCGSFDAGDEDDEDEDDEQDDADEQGDRPSYQEVCEMLTAALGCTGSTLEKLDAVSAVIANQPVADQFRRRLVFHRVSDKDMEILNSVFANLRARKEMEDQGRAEAEADELAEEEKAIMNEEEGPLPDKE